MIYCIGLGNPGEKYDHTRHNIGVRAIEYIHKKEGFSSFMSPQHKQFKSATGKIGKKAVVLIEPLVFMNVSGQVVGHIKTDLQKGSAGLVVIHDDVALPFGKIRISEARGDGGHNGVKSIISVLKTKKFIRIRIGVGPSIKKTTGEVVSKNTKVKLDSYVLKNLTPTEEKRVKDVFEEVRKSLIDMLELGIEKAMNNHN